MAKFYFDANDTGFGLSLLFHGCLDVQIQHRICSSRAFIHTLLEMNFFQSEWMLEYYSLEPCSRVSLLPKAVSMAVMTSLVNSGTTSSAAKFSWT
jgi:hypothetical protein